MEAVNEAVEEDWHELGGVVVAFQYSRRCPAVEREERRRCTVGSLIGGFGAFQREEGTAICWSNGAKTYPHRGRDRRSPRQDRETGRVDR